MDSYFIFQFRNSNPVQSVNLSKNLPKKSPRASRRIRPKICNPSDQFHKEIQNICRRGIGSPKYAKLDRFKLLFDRQRQRSVQNFITHVHIVLLVWRRSRCRCRRSLLSYLISQSENVPHTWLALAVHVLRTNKYPKIFIGMKTTFVWKLLIFQTTCPGSPIYVTETSSKYMYEQCM